MTARKKAAKKQAAEPEKGSGMFTGTVTDNQGKGPQGYYWDRLSEAGSREDLESLLDTLDAHRYSKDGQLYAAVTAKLNEVGGGSEGRRGR